MPSPCPDLDILVAAIAGLEALADQAGMTCELAGSKLSPGPYKLTGSRWMALNPYCWRYACPGPGASSWQGRRARWSPPGNRSRRSSSRKGTAVNLGYSQTVPIPTNFSTPAKRACSMSSIPIMALS